MTQSCLPGIAACWAVAAQQGTQQLGTAVDEGGVPPTLAATVQRLEAATERLEAQHQQLTATVPESGATVGEALDYVLRHWVDHPGRYSESYRHHHRWALGHCRQAIGDRRICDLGPEDATSLWSHLASIRRDGEKEGGRSLTSAASCIKPRLLNGESLGFGGLKRFVGLLPKTPQSPRRHFVVTHETHRDALEAIYWYDRHRRRSCDQSLRAIEIALRCPFRAGELVGLRRSELALDLGIVRLHDSKTGPRIVPLTDRGVQMLRQQLEELPWGSKFVFPSSKSACGHRLRSSLSSLWINIRRKYSESVGGQLDADGVCLHALRHFTCTRALDLGAPPQHTKQALGHSTKTMEERYTHGVSVPAVRAVVMLVEQDLDREGVA